MKKIGIMKNPKLALASDISERLEKVLTAEGHLVWACSTAEEEVARSQMADTDVVISVGGDGTILRVARTVIPETVPILGVNLGKLGFIAELSEPAEAIQKVSIFLSGENCWIDERAMLQVEIVCKGDSPDRIGEARCSNPYHALNEVVVGRGAVCRLVRVAVSIGGTPLTTYKADGVIVATATGSTGYSLATGGPIIYPQSQELLLNPISPHLCFRNALVLDPSTVLMLDASSDHGIIACIDGQVEIGLGSEDMVRVQRSPHVARFLRAGPPSYYYETLVRRLSSA